jgi:hypothetical protein
MCGLPQFVTFATQVCAQYVTIDNSHTSVKRVTFEMEDKAIEDKSRGRGRGLTEEG